MLADRKLVAFVPTTDPVRALAFYRDILGLKLLEDQRPFALVFDANGTMLRVTIVREWKAAEFTVLGWEVDDIRADLAALSNRGVKFDRYPFVEDESGIWTAPGGTMVAWFKDPDGNTLSLSQHPTP